MKTLKLRHSKINIIDWRDRYSYMFRNLYANFELSEDKGFQNELREKYNLDSWFFQSCLVEVKSKLDQNETQKKKKSEKISELQKILKTTEFKGKKERRNKFKIIDKLNYLLNHIEDDITFGSKALLRKISYLPNKIKQLTNKTEIEKAQKELAEAKEQYHQNRILAIVSIGEAPQKSNRKFDFDFPNKKMVFKPEQSIHIPFEIFCSKNQHGELCRLQEQIGEQAITVGIDNDYVYITFDNEKLNGFSFNKNEYFKEVKLIPKEEKQERKDCYKKWIHEQEARKLKGKNGSRYLGTDINPEYIGFVILEKQGKKNKLIFADCIDFTGLNTRMGLSSTDPEQVYQNNKRVHELYEAWKIIFKIAARFKVSHCVVEDLEFKEKGVNNKAKEVNRKTKNLWHREKTTELIQKYCDELGIILIPVNACYSSFIGNIQNNFFDPVAAAIEICRRGITKYLKGEFYPALGRTDLDSMCQMGLDVQGETISTWVEAYKLFNTAKLRYRRELQNFVENNLLSWKSRVKLYNFIPI